MKAIYKFPVKTAILMPVGARILALQVQHNVPMLWAICDTSAQTEPRLFNVRGTGFEFDAADEGAYIGTWQESGGSFVRHLFEVAA